MSSFFEIFLKKMKILLAILFGKCYNVFRKVFLKYFLTPRNIGKFCKKGYFSHVFIENFEKIDRKRLNSAKNDEKRY